MKKISSGSDLLPVTVMDLTGVYECEPFYRHCRFQWIDCRALPGTNGFCDADALRVLSQKIAGLPAEGIHFIDSGNHHYVTELWLNKIEVPFNLVVFDHHTDMKRPLFGDLLSCGVRILSRN